MTLIAHLWIEDFGCRGFFSCQRSNSTSPVTAFFVCGQIISVQKYMFPFISKVLHVCMDTGGVFQVQLVILEQPEPIIGLIGLYATRLLKMFSNHVVGNKNKVYRVFFPLVKSLLDVIVVKKLKFSSELLVHFKFCKVGPKMRREYFVLF